MFMRSPSPASFVSMIVKTVLTLLMASQQIGVPSGRTPVPSQNLLYTESGITELHDLHLASLRMARLARLDQLLALNETQRNRVLGVLREDVRKPFNEPGERVGTLLRTERLYPLLTKPQQVVFSRWRKNGELRRRTVDATECRAAAKLLAMRVADEIKCSAEQRRRLEVASIGLAIRFLKQPRRQQPKLTRQLLVEDGTYIPLLEEMPFWSKSITATVSPEQLAASKRFDERRALFYANANATVIAADLGLALHMKKMEVSGLRKLLMEELSTQRPMFPFREVSHPLLNLTESRLKGIVSAAHAKRIVELGTQERKRIEKLVERAKSEVKKQAGG